MTPLPDPTWIESRESIASLLFYYFPSGPRLDWNSAKGCDKTRHRDCATEIINRLNAPQGSNTGAPAAGHCHRCKGVSTLNAAGLCLDCATPGAAATGREEAYRQALESIAGNSCCDGCQEAKRVAESALRSPEEAGKEGSQTIYVFGDTCPTCDRPPSPVHPPQARECWVLFGFDGKAMGLCTEPDGKRIFPELKMEAVRMVEAPEASAEKGGN